MISECSDASSGITSAMEIENSGANLVSARKGVLICLEIWDVPWWISMATTCRATFMS